ncbi:PH domain-containing protein [Bacillus cytotoxicus]|uniref:PH domain-containing protein n=1 Tax=Bacillus cytotoxicus TaxID=580165 RepID=UPI00277D0B18|nr:PH domain-containing protein [Bacillus cytotoxicus]
MIDLKFKVKQNPIHIILFSTIAIAFIILFFLEDSHSLLNTFMLGMTLYNIISFFRSTYKFTSSSLIIHCGFVRTEILYEDIRHIKYYGKPLHSEKWTRQRLEFAYGLFDTLTACVPQNEDEFLSELKSKCPNVKILDRHVN